MSSIAKPPLFNFYDIVKLVNVDGKIEEIDRNFGIVLGMVQDSEFRIQNSDGGMLSAFIQTQVAKIGSPDGMFLK